MYFGAKPVVEINPLVSFPLSFLVDSTRSYSHSTFLQFADSVACVVVCILVYLGSDVQPAGVVCAVCAGRHDTAHSAQCAAPHLQRHQLPLNAIPTRNLVFSYCHLCIFIFAINKTIWLKSVSYLSQQNQRWAKKLLLTTSYLRRLRLSGKNLPARWLCKHTHCPRPHTPRPPSRSPRCPLQPLGWSAPRRRCR